MRRLSGEEIGDCLQNLTIDLLLAGPAAFQVGLRNDQRVVAAFDDVKGVARLHAPAHAFEHVERTEPVLRAAVVALAGLTKTSPREWLGAGRAIAWMLSSAPAQDVSRDEPILTFAPEAEVIGFRHRAPYVEAYFSPHSRGVVISGPDRRRHSQPATPPPSPSRISSCGICRNQGDKPLFSTLLQRFRCNPGKRR